MGCSPIERNRFLADRGSLLLGTLWQYLLTPSDYRTIEIVGVWWSANGELFVRFETRFTDDTEEGWLRETILADHLLADSSSFWYLGRAEDLSWIAPSTQVWDQEGEEFTISFLDGGVIHLANYALDIAVPVWEVVHEFQLIGPEPDLREEPGAVSNSSNIVISPNTPVGSTNSSSNVVTIPDTAFGMGINQAMMVKRLENIAVKVERPIPKKSRPTRFRRILGES